MKSLAILVALFLSVTCFAQIPQDTLKNKVKQDSVRQKAIAFVAGKLAVSRPFNIEFTSLMPYRYSSKLAGASLPESKVTRFNQIKVSSNFNFIRKKAWMLGGTFVYRYINTALDVTDHNNATSQNIIKDFHLHTTALNFTYFSRLFNKTAIVGSSLMVDGTEKHFERVKGMVYGTLLLKANARTKMAAGFVVNIDPITQLPVLPSFTYEHKLKNHFVIDVLVPKYVLIRKYFNNGRLSLGTELDKTSFFLYGINQSNISQKYEYQQIDFNSGFTYERLLDEHFILALRTGVKAVSNGRTFEKNKVRTPILEVVPQPAFYFNIGLSYNPFIKKIKK